MKLQQLQYVSAIVQHGSIRKAAQANFVSEPAVSKSLRELETEYSITLFERSHAGAVLTRDGEEFMTYARAILEHHNNLRRRFLQQDEDVRQYIKVAVRVPGKFEKVLIDILNKMDGSKLFNLTVYSNSTSEILDDLVSGNVDLGVVVILSHFEAYWNSLFAAKGLEFTPVGYRESLYLAVREGHPLTSKSFVEVSDLASYPALESYAGNPSSLSAILANEVKILIGMPPDINTVVVYDAAMYLSVLKNTDVFTIVGAARDEEVFFSDGIAYYRINTDIVFVSGVLKNAKRKFSDMAQGFLDSIVKYHK